MGENVPDDVLILNSRWSMLLKLKQDHVILQQLRDKVPKSIFPESGDNVESVLHANLNNPWLDDVRKYGRKGSTNGDIKNHTPMRRSMAVADGPSYRIENPIKMPPGYWMSRPATNGQLGGVLVIWRAAWSWVSRQSRKFPPNAWQYYVIYQHSLDHEMGVHRTRDNFDASSGKF
jgi:hypothetical protein